MGWVQGGKARLTCPQLSPAGKESIMSQFEAHPYATPGRKGESGGCEEVPISATAQTLFSLS